MYRRFLSLFVPTMLVLGVVLYLLHRMQAQDVERKLGYAQWRAVYSAQGAVDSALSGVVADLRYLADRAALSGPPRLEASTERRHLANDYLAFAARKRVYDQIRYLNRAGREVVRVNFDGGHPSIVPDDQLQDKSGRYYVRRGLALKPGQIYVSAFDLNTEHGKIERPFKPTIRFVAPVVDAHAAKRGIVVFNYLGAGLLAAVQQEIGFGNQMWLVNRRGFWLHGPVPADEWGFMLSDRRRRTMAYRYPRVWHTVTSKQAGALHTRRGWFTFMRISPETDVPQGRYWIVVSYLPPREVAAHLVPLRDWYLKLFGAATLILGATVWAFARLIGRWREAETETGRAHKRYADVINNLNVGIYRKTVGSEGRFLEVNDALVQMFEAGSRAELMSHPVSDLHLDPAARQAFSDRVMELGAVTGEEMEMRTLHGRRFWARQSAVARVDGTTDDVILDGVIADITAHRDAELALRDSEARFRGLLETAPDGIVIVNREGRIDLVNSQAEQLFGYSRTELVGCLVELLVPERLRGVHVHRRTDYWKQPVARSLGQRRELFARRRDGSEFPIEVSLSPHLTEAEHVVVASVRDLTERRKAEVEIRNLNAELGRHGAELEVLNKELESFSYSVSHDLRAPLRAIDGFSQALLEDYGQALDTTARDYLRRVRAGVQRMGELIDDLLRLSRVTRAELNREAVDLSALAGDVVSELSSADPGRQIECAIAPGLQTQGDRRLLRVALKNLLSNAWKFTAGRSDGRVEFGAEQNDGEPVYFVRDNGAGFDMAYVDKLFGAFQRLHDVREFPGSGIGLATVKRAVLKHGGRVWAEGRVGCGATFFFTL